jgi:hypothetical protein
MIKWGCAVHPKPVGTNNDALGLVEVYDVDGVNIGASEAVS